MFFHVTSSLKRFICEIVSLFFNVIIELQKSIYHLFTFASSAREQHSVQKLQENLSL